MQIPPPEKWSIWRVAGIAAFAVTVLLFMFVSSLAGMRWLGIVMLAGAVVQIIQRRIAYGWEGREPSGFITGFPAVVLGVMLGLAGAVMVAKPDLMLAIFGWQDQ